MKLRFIIILGLLLLAWNSCRHNETKAPLAKEAYGYARLDTLKQLLTINDETAKDTADAVKTYITTYADFGVGNEKIDLREKVYVYARESTVELVSHMDTDRLAGLLHGADKLALHNLPRSPMTYLVPGLAAILLLLYYYRLQDGTEYAHVGLAFAADGVGLFGFNACSDDYRPVCQMARIRPGDNSG